MTKREYGVDLYRTVATVLVVFLHVLGQGGILQHEAPDTATYWVAWLLQIGAYCAVNCFALLSGYLMVDRSVKVKSLLGLWLQVIFYSLVCTGVIFVLSPETRSFKNLAVSFAPIITERWWYISAYFGLFVFIPLLNAAVSRVSKKTYDYFLLAVLIGVCCLDQLSPKDVFSLKSGYSVLWLIVLYLFGAYIKKYDIKNKLPAWKSLLGFVTMVLLTFVSKVVLHVALGQAKIEDILVSYTSVTILLSAVFLFLFCLKVPLCGPVTKVVAVLASASLGVYLIHAHPLVWGYVIAGNFTDLAQSSPFVMVLWTTLAVLTIFLACTGIELLRIQLFQLLKLDRLCEKIAVLGDGLYEKLSKK